MRRALGIAAALLTLAVPATANAAIRYAAPDGGMVPGCVQSSPCSLEYAITGATSGDEIVVTPGEYLVPTTISTENPLFIHGQDGAPLPRIVGAAGVTPFKSFAPQHLSYLAFEANSNEGALFLPADGTVLERLELLVYGEEALGFRSGNNFTLTDSLIATGEGTYATGLFLQGTGSGAPQLRNDTILAAGSASTGIGIFVTKPSISIAMSAVNVIVDGHVDASTGISSGAPGSTATISFDHSNLDNTVGAVTSTNGQTAPPKFLDAGSLNFTEAPDSPTIDAGVNDSANGTFDLGGNPRSLPGKIDCSAPRPAVTDIGAYEFVPAVANAACPLPQVATTGIPDTKITGFKLRKRRVAFRFAASGGSGPVSFECRLDRKSFRPCSSPKAFKHLKPGKHVFRVRAIAGGQVDPTPAERKFRVKPKHRHRRHRQAA
jgi:hypothetical protein